MSEKILKGWKWIKLGEVAEIKMGQSPESKYYNDKGIGLPFLQGNKTFGYRYPEIDMFCSNPIKIARKGEILISVRAPVGDINITNQDICIGRGLASINSLFNQNEFLFYCLKYSKNDLLASETGTVFGSINKDTLNNFPILLPPLPEQKAIAEVLSSIDDKIDLLHRQNKTLEEMAMTLFRQWFIEPTKDGLPEGWEEKALDEIAEFLNGIPSQKYPGDKLPVIKIKEMREGITESSDYCNNNVPEKYLVNSGDILFSWSGSLEVVIWFGSIGVLNQHIFKVTSLEYPKWFCYLSIKQHIEEFRAIAESKTTTMGHIQREHLSNTKVFIPPKIFFENYNKAMTTIFDKIIANNAEIRTLEKLRDSLLPKLMSGEVRVKV